jgi:amidase
VARATLFGSSPGADALADRALDLLRDAGVEIVDDADRDESGTSLGTPTSWEDELVVLLHELRAGLEGYLATREPPAPRTLEQLVAANTALAERELGLFGQEFLADAAVIGDLTTQSYLEARDRNRAAARGWLDRICATHRLDAIVAPTMAPAWYIDDINGDPPVGGAYTAAAVAGYPAMSVPIGLAGGRLPVGLALLGRPYREGRLLSIARGLELLMGDQTRPGFVLE